MSKKKKESTKGFSTLIIILVIQLIIMLGLSLFITIMISNKTRDNAMQNMNSISDERAQLINNYVENAENTLRNFSKASQVKDLLRFQRTNNFDFHELLPAKGERASVPVSADESDTAAQNLIKADQLQKAAQAYTEDFGKDVVNLEGFWIGSWETHVLTHTNGDSVIGMTTRSDPDKLKQLQDSMQAGDNGLYDAGIIISPATQKQIVSMYIAIYDDDNTPLGLVGLGIFTDGLVDSLDSVPKRGIENSFYSMVNVKNNQYIFNGNNKDLVAQEATNKEILDLCKKFNGSKESVTDNFEYKMNGKSYICNYSYIPEKGWLLMIDDYKSEVLELRNTMIVYLVIFGIVILGLIIVFNIINKRQEKINQKLVSTIAKNNLTKKSLNTAMFKDVLTNANNRICFSMDAEKASADKNKRYYFMMFNICDFSGINTQFGNDAGDLVLVNTVERLKEQFAENDIYRTGSDEFTVMLPAEGDMASSDAVLDKVNTVLRDLLIPQTIENAGTVYPKFKVAVIKKAGPIDTSVVSVLKDMTNRTGEAIYGMIDYQDLT